MRIPTFNKKQKELLADLWELDEYERKEIAMFLIASTLNPGSHSRVYSKVKKFDKIIYINAFSIFYVFFFGLKNTKKRQILMHF